MRNYKQIVCINCMVVIFFLFGGKLLGQETKSNQKMMEKEITLSEFSSLKVSGLAKVYLIQGKENKAHLKVSGMPIDEVKLTVVQNELKISTPKDYSGEDVNVYLTYSQLNAISLNDAVELYSKGPLVVTSLHVSLKNMSKAEIEVYVDTLELSMKDNTDLTITGKAKKQKINSYSEKGTLINSELEIGK